MTTKASSIHDLSNRFGLLSIERSPQEKRLMSQKVLKECCLPEKRLMPQKLCEISRAMLKSVSGGFSPSEASTKLKEVKDGEKKLQSLAKDFDLLNTLSALDLESPVHKKEPKKPHFQVLEELDIEVRKTELNIELSTMGFDSFSTHEQRLHRFSEATSYLTTPLEYLAYATNKLSKEAKVFLPKGTAKFVKKALQNTPMKTKGKLGSGNFAEVHLVESHKERFALKKASARIPKEKKLPIETLKKHQRQAQEVLKKEASFYMTFDHPNIVRVEALSEAGLYLEWMEYGTLRDAINSNDFTAKMATKYLLDITRALNHVHERGYTHRDVNPENILISKNPLEAKLCDFGLSCLTDKDSDKSGSAAYMAPEITKFVHEKSPFISNKADSWSLGVIMFEIITGGHRPFSYIGEDRNVYLERIAKTCFNKPCDKEAIFKLVNENSRAKKKMKERDPTGMIRSLIIKCLDGDPNKRISCEDLEAIISKIILPKKVDMCSIS